MSSLTAERYLLHCLQQNCVLFSNIYFNRSYFEFVVSVVEKSLPGFLLTGAVFFFVSVVPAVGSNSNLVRTNSMLIDRGLFL